MVDPKNEKRVPEISIEEILKENEALKKENRKLKHVVADLTLDKEAQKDIIEAFKKKETQKVIEKLSKKSLDSKNTP